MHGRIPLLLNPQAGSFFASGLRSWLNDHTSEFRLIPTRDVEHLRKTAAELAASGAPLVAVAGGDGTLMGAAHGLIGSPTALGILPSGTMNVFSREMGIGSHRFDRALRTMREGHTTKVDIFAVNGKPFLQMAGFGQDARVIQLITPKLKKRWGAAAHLFTGIQVAMERYPVITITLPNGEELSGSQIIMGNGKRYGGEGRLFANACTRDGLLDAAIFHQDGLAVVMEVIGYMMQWGANSRNTSEMTQIRQFPHCTLQADSRMAYHLDGDYIETVEAGEIVEVKKLPHELKVCVPQEPTEDFFRTNFFAGGSSWNAFFKRIRNSSQF